MGLLDVNAEHKRQKQLELEGGRLMFRGMKRLLICIAVLWVLVAMIGLFAGRQQAAPDDRPSQSQRWHR